MDKERALFPYYTADKVADGALYTGPYTAIKVEGSSVWEPFAPLNESPSERVRTQADENIERNIYKNNSGSVVVFEEINHSLGLSFRYSWTSSAKFGLVRRAKLRNIGENSVKLRVLDGCRNIMAAGCLADTQAANSVLLDAYKKTDLVSIHPAYSGALNDRDRDGNIALFYLSSVLTDKAEPSEGLWANVCWFSTDDVPVIAQDAPAVFAAGGTPAVDGEVRGGRPACFIVRNVQLASGEEDSWYQVLDAHLDASDIASLEWDIKNRAQAVRLLEEDIKAGKRLLESYVAEADGVQQTSDTMACVHHEANVMMNIMRGGLVANNGKINIADFLLAIRQRNHAQLSAAEKAVSGIKADKDGFATYADVLNAVNAAGSNQLLRLFYEYMPLIFSRRHGDPSRPWNKFSIRLRDNDGNPVLNYEGNWRDIFQNWEALAFSYPLYVKNMAAKALNAMTADGYNPYRISREGVDWEIPAPANPWSFIGYWGDHQVIYLCKLLEMFKNTDRDALLAMLGKKIFSASNVPYRIKSYADILCDPRNTIVFDKPLSDSLISRADAEGSDAKLVQGKDGNVALVNMAAKLLQIVITKAANFVPGGGIWLNTQRPEWNDANNALAGWGLSVVTLCYLRRFVVFLIELFSASDNAEYALPKEVSKCFCTLGALYQSTAPDSACKSDAARKAFTDKAQKAFEAEREALYGGAYTHGDEAVPRENIISVLEAIKAHAEYTIRLNRRGDGLYHSYNILHADDSAMKVETLQEMLERQVAVLSSGYLTGAEALEVLTALKGSAMFEKRQGSYMLYSNKALTPFVKKNCVTPADVAPVMDLINRTGNSIMRKDLNGVYHFNADFRNDAVMQEALDKLDEDKKPTEEEREALSALYEKTFNHRSFTGRSTTFFAYERLGSIYWHMVSKLLLAVQENVFHAIASGEDDSAVNGLIAAYYDIRGGLGSSKTPALYGAFPADPYSHTPSGQGAKQPGMTGQVKEEVLTRWGELGVHYHDGAVSFRPLLLRREEAGDSGQVRFTLCGIPVTYTLGKDETITVHSAAGDTSRHEAALTESEARSLFSRNGSITSIDVTGM